MARRKRKNKIELYEMVNGLPESTIASNRPDTGGICGDDDHPPGNIIFGHRYQRRGYDNKLTPYNTIWDVDDKEDFKWDFFENLGGMEDILNYSNTLHGLKNLIPKETWDNAWKKMKKVSAADARKGFIMVGQPHRDAKDRTGIDSADYAEVSFGAKDTKVDNDDVEEIVEKLKKFSL